MISILDNDELYSSTQKAQIHLNENKSTILSTFVFFVFIFDSGGGLNLRNIGLILILMLLIYETFFNHGAKNINKYFLLFYCGSLSFLLASVIIALLNRATFVNANLHNFGLYSLLPFYILAKNRYLTINGYLKSVNIFCAIVLILFFGRLFGIAPVVQIFGFIATRADGFFRYVQFANSPLVIPNVYFQGMLATVPAAVIMVSQKKFKSFALVMLTLFIAPSRFGVFVCILFFLILYIKKIYIIIFASVVFVLSMILFEIPVFVDFLDIFDRTTYGHVVRTGHLESILFLFTSHLPYFIIGQGPGTMFFSLGFGSYTDSVEISHLDFIRKYGILYFIVLNIAFFYLMHKLYKKSILSKQLTYGLLAHYVVAASNPVLLSLPFMMFLSVCIVTSEADRRLYKNEKYLFTRNGI